jgi:hypothetical protein
MRCGLDAVAQSHFFAFSPIPLWSVTWLIKRADSKQHHPSEPV